MPVVEYKVPQSVDEAVGMLAENENAKLLAGGTDLIIQNRSQTGPEVVLVDIKSIDALMGASIDDDNLNLGPGMSCAEFTDREDIKSIFPGLVEAAYLIGSTQVQGRASVGGNLCNASPAADTIPALMANKAICIIQGPAGERQVAVEDFVTGVATNCMKHDEVLRVIQIAKPAKGTSDAYLRFIPRTEMDIAVAGAGVSLSLDSDGVCTAARVAIGAVAPTAILVQEAADALIGTKLEESDLVAAGKAASDAASPIDDRRATAEYRTHVIGVLVKRAAAIAADRARSNG